MEVPEKRGLVQKLNMVGGRNAAESLHGLPEELLAAIRQEFGAGCCDDEQAKKAIGRVYTSYNYLMDPHTACAWAVAETHRGNAPMVVLSTASPDKFSSDVLSAIGGDVSGSEFERMDRLQALTGVPIPPNLRSLRGKPELHTDVIPKEQMPDYVLRR